MEAISNKISEEYPDEKIFDNKKDQCRFNCIKH